MKQIKVELILRSTVTVPNTVTTSKQAPHSLALLSDSFLEDAWVLFSQAGAATAAETHALPAYLQSCIN